tara:strand:- start:213 stop:578 length:366 start_codon:yes stop_codon:yes gene_type:complete
MRKLLIPLLASIALPTTVNAENYRCFYEFQNKKESYQLIRKGNYFNWITKSDRKFKLSILSESPNELVLGGEFYFPELNYYKIYFLDKNSLKLHSGNIVAPKYFYSNNFPIQKLHQCFDNY